ncbi:MAG: universal stress protein [Desulfobacteraceae bacterium]|nr:universal stress protein [Desulfobacteraceae bacterium]
MERILAAMEPAQTHLFAGVHALNLAKRIQAKVLFLLVFPDRDAQAADPEKKSELSAVKKRVEALIEEGRSDGLSVDYYLTHGEYEGELVSFVQENKITLLVVECPPGHGGAADACRDMLDKLRHRINCRIEVVNPKPETPERKD